ncbi:UNVERIFIED_CONTAM: RNA-binding protein 25 [Sesamum angustifolium]|uniref:RNA-binding protein 25 n=2 Tax=Sesamum TaxID=4181 RepID=A0AAW2MU39_9LAMI
MADSTPAPETTAAADPNPVSQQPESDARPLHPDPSSAALPQFPNPNPSGPPPPSVFLLSAPDPIPSGPAASFCASRVGTPQFAPVTYQAPGARPGVVMGSRSWEWPAATGSGGLGAPGDAAAVLCVGSAYILKWLSCYASASSQGMHFHVLVVLVFEGVPRYPSPYAPMIRPAFPPRPLVGVMPPLARPPLVGVRPPIIPPVVRPPSTPTVTSAEPQTTVYVGKISSTVENDFMLSLLQLCGPVKSWKRPQDPTGTLKGFGFCEFESAEGVLRALRLLNKLSVDGQELMLNVNQTTREYLERYVEKKSESSKKTKESETESAEQEEASASVADANETTKSPGEPLKPASDEQKKDDNEMNKESPDAANFGLVTDEDRKADSEALEKLTGMIEERLKNKPLPPPPPQRPVDGASNSNAEQPSRSRDRESEEDVAKNGECFYQPYCPTATLLFQSTMVLLYTNDMLLLHLADSEDKNEDQKTAESKPSSEHDKNETGSPDRSRRRDRSRDRDRDREMRRDKERELERYEREREQERAKREKEREYRSREDERRFKAREKEWETREREREHWRKREREREKERAQERKWEIMDQERDGDDGYGKKRKYKTSDEERKRRQREKEEDLADRLREEEEIAEAKMKAEEEQKKQLEVLKTITSQPANGHETTILPNETNDESHDEADRAFTHKPSHGTSEGEGFLQNGTSDEFVISSNSASDPRQNSTLPTRKLGFGLSGSGKRAAVPSVFNEDEDEDAHKEKKMRPLVPIDYSTEEQQAVQPSMSEGSSANMAAAAEFAKRISTLNPKEEKPDIEKEKSRRSHERSSQRDRDRHEEGISGTREESRRPENQKLLDAKQLIDTIPKTKDELFSYEINWVIYDQNALHERMRPWISKKITDFLGEEEDTLVDYIVSSTQEHVDAGEMLERLQTILDDEAEMFVLKMWRMLIFEIKKVETGLAPRLRA